MPRSPSSARRIPALLRRGGRSPVVGGGGPLAPSQTALKNWWQPSGLTVATSTWLDDGTEGATLTQGFANPAAVGIPIDGYQAIFGNNSNALENATTDIAASAPRESWIVLRPDDLSTQLAFDGLTGSNRNTLFVGSTGVITANAGSNLASATGAAPEHRAMLLRIVVNGDGSGAIYRVASVAGATSSPIASGTIGSGRWQGITLAASNAGSSGWKGEIAELLRYEAVLSSGDAATTAAYLLAKYPSVAKIGRTAINLDCLGDSLTEGFASSSGYSYKLALFTEFEANDISPTETLLFNGTINQRCLDHNGVTGETISQIEARAAAAISGSAADVLVLLAGTNDCQSGGYNGATAEAAYASLLATIYAADPALPVVLCLVPPLTNTTHNANANDLNSRLVSTVIPAADSAITTVDVRDAGFTTGAGFTTDGVHFNTAGENAAAEVIAAGIRAAL